MLLPASGTRDDAGGALPLRILGLFPIEGFIWLESANSPGQDCSLQFFSRGHGLWRVSPAKPPQRP